MSMLILKKKNKKTLTRLIHLLDIIYICSSCIDKGTIRRECEFNNQHHKFSLNNAFVFIKLTVFFFAN
jgi:hypothetical protein